LHHGHTQIFDITLPSGETLNQSSFGDDIKVPYFTADANNNFDGVQTSAPITLQPIPEPFSALLFGTGPLVTLLIARRVQA
jgi:hypothetical protein